MTHIRQQILDLLGNRLIENIDEELFSGEISDEPEEEEAVEDEVEEPAETHISGISDKYQTGLLKILPKIFLDPEIFNGFYQCLSANFNPNLPKFTHSLDVITVVFNDFNMSCLLGYPFGIIKEAVDNLEDDPKVKKGSGLKQGATHKANIIGFFKHKPKIHILQPEQIKKDLTNLAISCNIITFKRLEHYGNTEHFATPWAMQDIFKTNSSVSDDFVSNLSKPILTAFYKDNNQFSNYLKTFDWGKPNYIAEAKGSEVGADFGLTSGFDEFLVNAISFYLLDVVKHGTPNPANILPASNSKAIADSMAVGKETTAIARSAHSSLDAPVSDDSTRSLESILDTADSEETAELGDLPAVELDINATNENTVENAILFTRYIQQLKRENHWDAKSTLEWLHSRLDVGGSAGLPTILEQVINSLPENVYEDKLSCFSNKDGKIIPTNILAEIKSWASRKLMTELSAIVDTICLTESETLNVETLNELIVELPKTEQDMLDQFSITGSRTSGYIISNWSKDDLAIREITNIYEKYKAESITGKVLSEYAFANIVAGDLSPTSPLQRTFNLNLSPASGEAFHSQKQQSRKQALVGGADATSEMAFNIYYNAIKDILLPDVNQADWGLLEPTTSPEGGSFYYIAHPSQEKFPPSGVTVPKGGYIVPEGNTLNGSYTVGDTARIKAVFPTATAFTTFANTLLNDIQAEKPNFLAAKTLDEFKAVLNKIVTKHKKELTKLKHFSSPKTQKLSIGKTTLGKLFENPTVGKSAGTTPINAFAKVVLAENKSVLSKLLLPLTITEAAEDTTPTTGTLPYYFFTLNSYTRASILLALSNFYSLLETILILLRQLTIELPDLVILNLSRDASTKLFSQLADIISHLLSENPGGTIASALIKSSIGFLQDRYGEASAYSMESLPDVEQAITARPKKVYG
jgi:hypothetical protein